MELLAFHHRWVSEFHMKVCLGEMDELLVQVFRSYSKDEMVLMVSHKRMDVQSREKDAQMSAEDGG